MSRGLIEPQVARTLGVFLSILVFIGFMAWPNIQEMLALGPKLEVTVVDCTTGAPISGADVFMPMASWRQRGVTDGNGVTEIDLSRVERGRWLVIVGKDGYQGASGGVTAPGPAVTVEMCRGEPPNPYGFGEN